MKTITTLFFTLCITLISVAQNGFNYKAVIKDSNGNLITNETIDVRFTIQKSNGTGIYSETHNTTTNNNGLIILNIGEGTTTDNFSLIGWENDTYQLQTEVDFEQDGSYEIIGSAAPFKAVPYSKLSNRALVANIANNVATTLNDLNDARSDANNTSLFLGFDAGLNDDGTDNYNTSLGANSLLSNTNGTNNVALGAETLFSNTNGIDNTASGFRALYSNTSGIRNSAIGNRALFTNTTGSENTALGQLALHNNTIGNDNTAVGSASLFLNTEGIHNTATGHSALYSNTSGNDNTALGYTALYSNTSGEDNTAIGKFSLLLNTTGNNNTAIGHSTLYSNTTGVENVAIGNEALNSNTTGYRNIAIGKESLYFNLDGISNLAIGYNALNKNTDGNSNIALGDSALSFNDDGNGNIAVGALALEKNSIGNYNTAIGIRTLNDFTRGWYNVAIGFNALSETNSNGSTILTNNNIGIGAEAEVPSSIGSNQVRIGNTDITYAGIQVGWTITSDRIWKDKVRELPYGLDMVMQLKPVDYTRKNNDKQTREMGFIAQDLEALLNKLGYKDQGFLTKDDKGRLGVRYNDLIALLTKAIQEQQVIIKEQNTKIQVQALENIKQNQSIQSLLQRMDTLDASMN